MNDSFNPIFILESGKYVRFLRKRFWVILAVYVVYFCAASSFGSYVQYTMRDSLVNFVINASVYALVLSVAVPFATYPASVLPKKHVEQDLILHTPLSDFQVISGFAWSAVVAAGFVCTLGLALLLPFNITIEAPEMIPLLFLDIASVFCWTQICNGIAISIYSGIREPLHYTFSSIVLYMFVFPLLCIFIAGSVGMFVYLHQVCNWSDSAVRVSVFGYSVFCLGACFCATLYFMKANTYKSTYYREKIFYTILVFVILFYALLFISFLLFNLIALFVHWSHFGTIYP